MSTSVYTINKGINKPVEFKGLRAQYIWYLGGGIIVLLVLFALMYICGLHTFLCLAVVATLCPLLFAYVYRLSRNYGEHGLMKKLARKRVPRQVRCYCLLFEPSKKENE